MKTTRKTRIVLFVAMLIRFSSVSLFIFQPTRESARCIAAETIASHEENNSLSRTSFWFDSAAGNDVTGNGTSSSPWKTIARANELMGSLNPGDSLVFTGTTFHDSLVVTDDGLIISSPDSAVFLGSATCSADPGSWRNLGENMWGTYIGGLTSAVWLDNKYGIYDTAPDSDGEWYIHDSDELRIYCHINPAIAWKTIRYGDLPYVLKIESTHVRIENIDIRYFASPDTLSADFERDGAIAVWPSAHDIYIGGCELFNVSLGMNFINQAHTIEVANCSIRRVYDAVGKWPGGIGMMWNNHHVSVHDCHIDNTAIAVNGDTLRYGECIRIPVDDETADYVLWFPDFTDIYNCDLQGFAITGIKISHLADSGYRHFESCRIHHNNIHGSIMSGGIFDDRDGIGCGSRTSVTQGLSGVTVYNNHLHHIYHTGIKFGDKWYNCHIYNNVIHDIGYLETSPYNQAAIAVNASIHVYHNTINRFGHAYGINIAYHGNIVQKSEVRNNIISNGAGMALTAGGWDIATASHLILFNTGGIYVTVDTSHVIIDDPLFHESEINDYSLLETSPAIDNGVNIAFIETDYIGTERPQNSVSDIGAYEYIAPVGITETPESMVSVQSYPNPFNASTVIRYHLPEGSFMTIAIYTPRGRKVATVVDGFVPAGDHAVTFDGKNLASGLYLYTIDTMSATITKKMLLLK